MAEIFAECFTLILQLRASEEYGEADTLRRRIKSMLDRAEREALQVGVPSQDVRTASFAVVAFLDETILSSDWSQKDGWLAKPLQMELFDRYDAGEEFFTRLEELLEEPGANAEILEVYFLCMALGFKGKYQMHAQEQLRLLIEDTHEALRKQPGLRADHLSPHGKPRDQVVEEVKSKMPLWVVAVVAVSIGLLAYVGMSFYMSGTAGDAAQNIEQVSQLNRSR